MMMMIKVAFFSLLGVLCVTSITVETSGTSVLSNEGRIRVGFDWFRNLFSTPVHVQVLRNLPLPAHVIVDTRPVKVEIGAPKNSGSEENPNPDLSGSLVRVNVPVITQVKVGDGQWSVFNKHGSRPQQLTTGVPNTDNEEIADKNVKEMADKDDKEMADREISDKEVNNDP